MRVGSGESCEGSKGYDVERDLVRMKTRLLDLEDKVASLEGKLEGVAAGVSRPALAADRPGTILWAMKVAAGGGKMRRPSWHKDWVLTFVEGAFAVSGGGVMRESLDPVDLASDDWYADWTVD